MVFISECLPGGPGGGTDEKDRSFFNPQKYKACMLVSSLPYLQNLNSSALCV